MPEQALLVHDCSADRGGVMAITVRSMRRPFWVRKELLGACRATTSSNELSRRATATHSSGGACPPCSKTVFTRRIRWTSREAPSPSNASCHRTCLPAWNGARRSTPTVSALNPDCVLSAARSSLCRRGGRKSAAALKPMDFRAASSVAFCYRCRYASRIMFDMSIRRVARNSG